MAPQIFKATYSGVPVYEMIADGVSVMRRRADGWLNATQILKVAGFDKPQRTRVLEREVQKGLHEKVQGGYGKYQGTWVPPEAALAIARQYDVEHHLRPIIDYRPSENSPPPAPKHSASSNNLAPPAVRGGRHRSPSGYSSTRTRSARHRSASIESRSDLETFTAGDGSSAPSATPSPVISVTSLSVDGEEPSFSHLSPRKRKRDSPDPDVEFGDVMLEYFISETAEIPQILINPSPTLNTDVEIDSDGHSALHWAAAMCRIRVVKLLLSAGADPFKVNKKGQTALMRSVQFANNYDLRKFAELYELLHRTTLNIDTYNRTVFHHIVDLAMNKGRLHAARYYMETALIRLADYPRELADIINFQDNDGETALTMAARCRSKRLVKVLLDHGADPNIRNRDGKSAEDYIIDDERFRSSPTLAARTLFRMGALDPKTQESIAARRAGDEVFNAMTGKFDELLTCFDGELKRRQKEIIQATEILVELEREVKNTDKAIEELKRNNNDNLDARKALLRQMGSDVQTRAHKRSRLGLQQWLGEEKEREEALWKSNRGLSKDNIAKAVPATLKGRTAIDDVSDLAELYSDLPKGQGQVEAVCQELRAEVERLSRRTDALVKEYAEGQAEAREDGKASEFRRLVAAAWPDIPQGEIDSVLTEVLRVLEAT